MATTTAKRRCIARPVMQTRTAASMSFDEDFPDMGQELYTAEEAYELTMKDIRAIYDVRDAV